MPTRNRGTTALGNTPGGRGRLPGNIQTQADYYRSGRSSALNPGATVRDQRGKVVSGNAKS